MDEIQEFGEYFIEQYADEEGRLDQEIADCYDEIPFILRVISSYFDYQEEIAKTEFLSSISDDGLKEAEILKDKILSAGDSLLILGAYFGPGFRRNSVNSSYGFSYAGSGRSRGVPRRPAL